MQHCCLELQHITIPSLTPNNCGKYKLQRRYIFSERHLLVSNALLFIFRLIFISFSFFYFPGLRPYCYSILIYRFFSHTNDYTYVKVIFLWLKHIYNNFPVSQICFQRITVLTGLPRHSTLRRFFIFVCVKVNDIFIFGLYLTELFSCLVLFIGNGLQPSSSSRIHISRRYIFNPIIFIDY